MKTGSPEWFRAKYAAMLIAHLSLTEPREDTPTDVELSAEEESSRDKGGDKHAS
jgi:hypothetical protein